MSDIHEIVRRLRDEDAAGVPAAENGNALIRRVAGASIEEIDRVIVELESVRDMLRNEGVRVSREVAGYASLSHAATTAMKVIADSIKLRTGSLAEEHDVRITPQHARELRATARRMCLGRGCDHFRVLDVCGY